jgi:hypothetical protein
MWAYWIRLITAAARLPVRIDPAVVIQVWRRHYNVVRLLNSLNYFIPDEFKQQHHLSTNRAFAQE